MSRHDKLNRYLFTVMALVIIVFLSFIMIKDIFNDNEYSEIGYPDNSLISEEKAKKLINKNLRENIISINSINLIDSLKTLYYAPVSQLRLKKPEEAADIDYETFGVSGEEPMVPDYSYYHSSSSSNNIILINIKEKDSRIIFKKRVCIIDHELYSFKDKKYLLLVIADNDTNNDKLIDRKDLLDIYVYDVFDYKLLRITKSSLHIIDLINPSPLFFNRWSDKNRETSNEIFVKIGYDKNSDGYYNADNEPVLIKRVDLLERKLVNILDQDMQSQLQSILDGESKM